MKSRLSRRIEKQSKKNLVITLFGIILLVVFLAQFGIPLIEKSTLFVINAKNTNSETEDKVDTVSFIPPPVINPLPEATNSAEIVVSGTTQSNQKINLYLNDELIDTTQVKDNKFSFSDIKIKEGENTLKTKAVTKENKKSAYSNIITILFKKTPPSLSLDTPSDNQSFSKDDKYAAISGKTDSNVKITVNDSWAIVDSDGKFSYSFPLQNGENKIKVVAMDAAGNKTEMERKVTYSP